MNPSRWASTCMTRPASASVRATARNGKNSPKREWDKYTFGVYGCWVMDDDGNLDYVPEEEYTEELWNEQKKSAERNRAAGVHK